jgi:hypothetical protein
MQNTFKNIILLGEIHGTESNIWALEALCHEVMTKDKGVTVALEVSTTWNAVLAALNRGDAGPLRGIMENTEEFESGRMSEKHIDAYVRLVTQGVRFVAIRDDNEDWNTTDKGMADNILKESKGTDVLIATLGNMHIMKKSFIGDWMRGEYVCHPTGELLKGVATSILINYHAGMYRNYETIAPLPSHKKCQSLKSKVGAIFAVENESHDYEMCVRESDVV